LSAVFLGAHTPGFAEGNLYRGAVGIGRRFAHKGSFADIHFVYELFTGDSHEASLLSNLIFNFTARLHSPSSYETTGVFLECLICSAKLVAEEHELAIAVSRDTLKGSMLSVLRG
jgi:hypothetical protein